MKLATFMQNGQPGLGVFTGRGVLDVKSAVRRLRPVGEGIPVSVMETIRGNAPAVEALRRLVEHCLSADGLEELFLEEEGLVWGPCVTHPGKILCVGLNYRKHAAESNLPVPDYPILFSKFGNTLAGHGQEIVLPEASTQVDYEAELAIVIGKTAKAVPKESALEHVFGYCCANDLSARDLQMRTSQWLLGKTCDGFCPLGPALVTADEAGDPNRLPIRTTVNGELRQNSDTSDMIFSCEEIVSYVSHYMTLDPGDVILTGTPEGVVLGYPPEKRVWLAPGDTVTVEIGNLGRLTNRMAAGQ